MTERANQRQNSNQELQVTDRRGRLERDTVQEMRDHGRRNLPALPGNLDRDELRQELRAGGNAGRGQDTNGQDARGNYFSATGTNVWGGGVGGRVGGGFGFGFGRAQFASDDPAAVQAAGDPLNAVMTMLGKSQNPAAAMAARKIEEIMLAQVEDGSMAGIFDRGKGGSALKRALLAAQSTINAADAGYFELAIQSLNSNGTFRLTGAEEYRLVVGTNNLMRFDDQRNGNQVELSGINGGGLGGISGTNMNTFNTGPSRTATVANQWLGTVGTGLAYLREGMKIRDEFRGTPKTAAAAQPKEREKPIPDGMTRDSFGDLVEKGKET
jgi:hypothetical protein